VPSGSYERETKMIANTERTVVIPGSYKELPKNFSIKGFIFGEEVEGKATPESVLGLFTSIPRGMNQSASLIFYILIIGAVFNIIQHTGTINVFMYKLMEKYRSSPFFLILGVFLMIYVSASFMGMGSEFIPLIPLFLLLSKEFGYDRLFGIALFLIPSNIGWTSAITNPFNVQIAQSVAEVPIGSGMGLRIVIFIICFIVSFIFLMRYGKKVKRKNQEAKSVEAFELGDDLKLEKSNLERKHYLIIANAIILFSLILYAVQTMGWGLIEMTGGFFMLGLTTILISGMSNEEAMKAFVKGLEMMIIPALIVGFARGIQVVMFDGQIVDSILHSTADLLSSMPKTLAVEGMFGFQSFLNFFIPSASGQALVSMPLMVPLADLLGISRQTSVLAFVLGDGFSNILIPTNGELMAILGIAMVPFEKWFKFILPLFLIMSVIAMTFLFIAIFISY
jgi:uncharacterized ion transporter superfamily protein YfcC